jgi:hypothetical protein
MEHPLVDYDPLPNFPIRRELASLFSNSLKRQTARKPHQKRFMRIQLTRFDFIIFVYWDFSLDETFPLFKLLNIDQRRNINGRVLACLKELKYSFRYI